MVFSLKHAGIAVVFLGSFSFYSLVFSSSLGKAKLEFTGELGVNHLQLGNSSYQITETETDNLHQTHNPVVGQFSLGVGYFFPFSRTASPATQWQWFSGLRAALNLHYFDHDFFNNEIRGQIEQYQDPTMNNYLYGISIANARLMFNVALTLATLKKFSLFVSGGIGSTWTKLRYDDEPVLGVEAGALSLSSYKKTGFAAEGGVGIAYQIKENTHLLLQYLYADLGTVRTANTGILDGEFAVIGPARFHLRSQGISLGIRINP